MKVHSFCVAAVLACSAVGAQAQFQKPEDAVKYRQAAFTVMGAHFSRLGAMANGRVPFDAAVAQQNAAVVLAMSRLPWAGFGPETERISSQAKPAVWREADRFRAGADRHTAAVAALDAAARTGNIDNLRRAFSDTAQSCKACHDAFRD